MMRYWVIIPAAGSGARMRAQQPHPLPKQYLRLCGKTILEHTLARFLARADIAGITVALALDDAEWQTLQVSHESRIQTVAGGTQRCHSVCNGLRALAGRASADDWVLVHDAARPCLHPDDLARLMTQLKTHPAGGLLAHPVSDTLKRAHPNGQVIATEDRRALWHAQTPQMFRYALLLDALERAIAEGHAVTDEAMAMERCGHAVQLVLGRKDNIKITEAPDLALAESFLGAESPLSEKR